ncbi:hypothetical protein FSARC_5929 [Fusarium sarcochroum]|uniref:Uncharacterized protein n=1 Tax=Fusarium sarcochroum TaxID=1208366 RepID=A0A8H4TYJ2_9HYPO|nr:hypothetical protein FSARC_5929 [Fusarium sarcochroum]
MPNNTDKSGTPSNASKKAVQTTKRGNQGQKILPAQDVDKIKQWAKDKADEDNEEGGVKLKQDEDTEEGGVKL